MRRAMRSVRWRDAMPGLQVMIGGSGMGIGRRWRMRTHQVFEGFPGRHKDAEGVGMLVAIVLQRHIHEIAVAT
jgi:hypothetical protein